MGYVVTTETATVYKVRYERVEGEPHQFGWADAAVRTFPGGGAISIQSDYGTYANTWTATGTGPFIGFLCRLDFDYFMTKACPGYLVFDHDKSMRELKVRIIEDRRHGRVGGLTKSEARELWNDVELFGADFGSADYWASEIMRSRSLSDWLDGDYDFVKHRPSPQAVGFWKEIWPHLVASWRGELL